MKYISKSQFAFSNRCLLISLFFALLSVSLALVGLGAISKGTGDTKQSMSSPQTAAARPNVQPPSKNATPRDNPHRYLDEKGNRANGIKPGPAVPAKHRRRKACRKWRLDLTWSAGRGRVRCRSLDYRCQHRASWPRARWQLRRYALPFQ